MNTMILVYITILIRIVFNASTYNPLDIHKYFFSDTLPPSVFFGHPKLVAHSTKGQ